MLKISIIVAAFASLALPSSANTQFPYNEKCVDHAMRPEYCVYRCETGVDLIDYERHSYSKGKRFPDAVTFKYGEIKFTVPNSSIPGSTASMYGDTKSLNGTGVSHWNKYTTLKLNGKSIKCFPSWI